MKFSHHIVTPSSTIQCKALIACTAIKEELITEIYYVKVACTSFIHTCFHNLPFVHTYIKGGKIHHTYLFYDRESGRWS